MTTPTTVNVQFQLRADTAANWTAANPTLLANEFALETDTKKLKVGDGTTAWTSLTYFPSIVTGGTVLGNLEIGSTGTLTFEGSTADDYETTLAVTDPTADRTITLPDQSGTVVVSGNASIVDADIAAGAEIAVSKLANGTVNQVLVTDGTDVSWSDDLTLAGNLTVNGTTTTVNTQDLLVEDKNIIIGNVTTPDDTTANAGGITLKGASDKTINWYDATDSWTSSENIDLASGKSYRINDTEVLSATTLGSGVTSSSLTSVGTISSGTWQGTAIDAAYLDSTVVTTGDTGTVTSTMIADGTIVDANVSASAAIAGSKIDPDFGSQTVETTGVFSAAAGSNSAPSITFTGDLNTGIYSPGGDQVAISTNGTQRINIEADGDINIDSGGVFYDATNNRLAIGTTSPAYLLHVDAGTGLNSMRVQGQLSGSTRTVTLGHNASGQAELLAGSAGGADNTLNIFGSPTIFGLNAANEHARIDSSGRLLVGTSTSIGSDSKVQIKDGYLNIYHADSAENSGYGIYFSTDGGATARPKARILAAQTAGNGGNLLFSTTADGASSPTERMRIASDGAFNCYTGSNEGFSVRTSAGAGTGAYIYQGFRSASSTSSGTVVFRVYSNGNIENTNNSYGALSDIKLKENIVDASSQWDDIKALRPVNYNFKEGQTHTQLGLIAQEVELVSPSLVSESPDRDEDGNDLGTVTKSVKYSVLYMKAVKALQEAMERIETLEAKVAALETP